MRRVKGRPDLASATAASTSHAAPRPGRCAAHRLRLACPTSSSQGVFVPLTYVNVCQFRQDRQMADVDPMPLARPNRQNHAAKQQMLRVIFGILPGLTGQSRYDVNPYGTVLKCRKPVRAASGEGIVTSRFSASYPRARTMRDERLHPESKPRGRQLCGRGL